MRLHRIHRTMLVLVAVLTLTAWAQAHTKLEKSEPADGATLTTPPTSVQLFFNEKPDLKVTKVDITGPSGKVELGPAHSMQRSRAHSETGNTRSTGRPPAKTGTFRKARSRFPCRRRNRRLQSHPTLIEVARRFGTVNPGYAATEKAHP